MIPDIVFEDNSSGEKMLYIFDPKYKDDKDLSNECKQQEELEEIEDIEENNNKKFSSDSITQMHKYKEAIIDFHNKRRVVKGAYIIIPKKSYNESDLQKFYDIRYKKEYGIGIVVLDPKIPIDKREKIFDIIND